METWVLVVYLLAGSQSTATPPRIASTSNEFGSLEACQSALQTIKRIDAISISIFSAECMKSGFIYQDGKRIPKSAT